MSINLSVWILIRYAVYLSERIIVKFAANIVVKNCKNGDMAIIKTIHAIKLARGL